MNGQPRHHEHVPNEIVHVCLYAYVRDMIYMFVVVCAYRSVEIWWQAWQ